MVQFLSHADETDGADLRCLIIFFKLKRTLNHYFIHLKKNKVFKTFATFVVNFF